MKSLKEWKLVNLEISSVIVCTLAILSAIGFILCAFLDAAIWLLIIMLILVVVFGIAVLWIVFVDEQEIIETEIAHNMEIKHKHHLDDFKIHGTATVRRVDIDEVEDLLLEESREKNKEEKEAQK